MKKRKLLALLAAGMMAMSLFVGCSSSSSNQAKTESSDKKIKVGLSTDEGGLNDKSFNESANSGIKKAKNEFGIEYKPVESKQKEDFESNLEALVNDGSDLTFAIGYQMEQAIGNVADKYKDKKFALVDAVVEKPNIKSIKFKDQEGSFLMGVIAGKMTKTNKIGFIGGKDCELIRKFEVGFAAGVKASNPEAAKGLIGDGKEKGTMVKYADSFTDTNKGYELAKSLYGSGCDVIYHAAGGAGMGMFKAAKEISKPDKKVWAIGVDQDQAVMFPDYASVILSSMIKKVDVATYNTVKEVIDNKFQGGKLVELGLKDDAMQIAPTSDKNTPKEVLDVVEKYKNAIKEGKVEVPSERAGLVKFNAPEIK